MKIECWFTETCIKFSLSNHLTRIMRGKNGNAASHLEETTRYDFRSRKRNELEALTGRFDVIVAHGDYIASEPAPDPYLKAAERLGIEPKLCLALEDSFNGIRSAASAGMITVMVPDLLAPTDEIRLLSTFVVDDLHVVRGLILRAPPRGPDRGSISSGGSLLHSN